jgi:Domain of unknown function (DU1801)
MYNPSSEVTEFLDKLSHPFRNEIELLRNYILTANKDLVENIKWNGPNYCFNKQDRITMRIQPLTAKHIQVIFHCGVKSQEQRTERILKDNFSLLNWKTNDRAVATFKNMQEIKEEEDNLKKIVNKWLDIKI